jgi:hypothetical protein
MKKLTEQQKVELANAAPRAMAGLTDGSFWTDVQKALEQKDAERQEQIAPRKLKAKPNY